MLTQLSLRTKFLALLLLGVFGVTVATLLVVQGAVENQIRADIVDDLRNAALTFKAFQAEREATLSHSAELIADLPTVKALMTTGDVNTIQDAVDVTFHLSGGDLLVLGAADGNIMAVSSKEKQINRTSIQEEFHRSVAGPANKRWWSLNGHLYEVFLQVMYFGSAKDDRALGVLALGYEINADLAADVSRITGSQVTFLNGSSLVATTLDPSRKADFEREIAQVAGLTSSAPEEMRLGNERYLGSRVGLTSGDSPGVQLSVLQSYDAATARFRGLYRILVGLGILSLFGVSLLAFGIFRRYARPLEKLMAAVSALGKGDFNYPLAAQGKDELAEATASFIRMRGDLQEAQRKLLESERLATIGRMASSISHDLRHQLTSIVANSEFLSEPDLDREQSEELYQEIRDAVGRMTELIDSLLEFSKGRDALSLSYGSVEETVQRAMRAVHKHPSVQDVSIEVSHTGSCEGWFDARRLERAFYNLLLNACQAVAPNPGKVKVEILRVSQGLEILVQDNGPGIPEPLRDKIFQPFVSQGKEHGTGLGLTIVQKIVEEHGGTIQLANSTPGHTTFHLIIPLGSSVEAETVDDVSSMSSDNITSTH